MKTFLLSIVLVVLLAGLSAVTSAEAGEVALSPIYTLYNDNEMESSLGLKLTYKPKESFYAWASAEELLRRFSGQECIDMQIYGVGLGLLEEIVDGLFLSIDTGYFLPHRRKTRPAFHADGALLHMIDVLGSYAKSWTHYGYEIGGGFGGSVGIAFDYELTDRWRIGGWTAYRVLKLEEFVFGYDEDAFDSGLPHHEVFEHTSFSGMQFGFKVIIGL